MKTLMLTLLPSTELNTSCGEPHLIPQTNSEDILSSFSEKEIETQEGNITSNMTQPR